ncbi:MAG: thioredoxin domain-containing protein [Acidobacteria bacterium]|nr:thioredoxin domain-containing protein [Acidobacteriota bacterium]
MDKICRKSFPAVLLLCVLTLPTFAQSPKPTPSSEKRQTLAEVNGTEISADEMERTLEVQLAQLEEQMYQLKRNRLEALIAEKLLSQEAERRAIPLQALLDLEINAKAGTVSEKDIEAFYQANQSQIGGQLDTNLKERIRSYLQTQRVNVRRDEFIQSLRATAKIAINLPLPNVRIKTGIEGAPFKGATNAPVTIIEFSDFHCPFCSKVQSTLTQVMARYGEKVKLVYRNFPIDQLHPQARRAAEAAKCAQEQGKFWEYHDRLYSGSADASTEKLKALAQAAGLDAAGFESCLASSRVQTAIQKDVEEGIRLGLTGTPAFLVNGRLLSGAQPLESFIRVIEEELGQRLESTATRQSVAPVLPTTQESPKRRIPIEQPPSLQETAAQENDKKRPAANKQSQEKIYTNDKAGYTLVYPSHWFASDIVYANAFELRNYNPQNPQSAPERNQAIVVIIETLNDSAEVTEGFLNNLKPQQPFGLTHFTINGSHAVQLTRRVNERSLGPGALRTSTVKPPDTLRSYFLIETYIAHGKSLLSIQATVPVDADSSVIAETIGIGERLKLFKATGIR